MKMVLLLRIYYLCVSEPEIWHPYILILKLLASMKFCYAEDNHNFFPLFFLSLVWAFFSFLYLLDTVVPDFQIPSPQMTSLISMEDIKLRSKKLSSVK